jgi:DNA-binding transcriptional ArsR family regulator
MWRAESLDNILVISKILDMLQAGTFDALASPRRREILRLVWNEERRAGDISAAMPDVTFGAVSLHLKSLERAGLLQSRRDGQCRYYQARRAALGPVAEALEAMWDDALWKLKLAAELEESRRGPRPARRRRVRRKE